MNEETRKMLEELASNLGVSVEFLWQTMIKGMFAEGITNVIFILLILIFIFVIFLIIRKISLDDSYDDDTVLFAKVTAAVLTVLLSLPLSVNIYNSIMYLTVPEYMAIKEILGVLK